MKEMFFRFSTLTLIFIFLLLTHSLRAQTRTWQYKPDGQDFVCVNGTNRYTRALYGSHDEDRIDTSDRPVFVLYKKKDSRNLRFRIAGVPLDSTDYCEARYTPGRRSYILRDHRWVKGEVRLTVLAYPDRQGGLFKFQVSGFKDKVEITGIMCDIANQKLSRNGDMGTEKPGSMEADPRGANMEIRELEIMGDASTGSIQVGYFSVEQQHLMVKDAATAFAQAEEYRKALASRVVFKTPDPYINTLGAVLTTAADGTWDDRTGTILHGAVGWRMPLAGWRGAYVNDFLGWPDRAKRHFEAYANSQLTDKPCTMPYATPDSAMNLARGIHKWGTTIYSNGYICRMPDDTKKMNHYDMNLNYIDELLWHFSFDADTVYLRRMWPVLQRHLAWEKQAFDRDGDGLYDAYAAIWASDGLYYNGGGGAHSSAYYYRAIKMAARIATILGEDSTPYITEANHIIDAMNAKLWFTNPQGYSCWAEYVDLMGLQRRHESPALWSVYTPVDSWACTPEQAYEATRWVDENIPHIPVYIDGEKTEYYTLSTSNWMPYDWSINNVAFAEVMHTALAYYHAGRNDEAFRIMKSDILDEMYLGHSPGNLGQISTYDVACGEMYRDFADNVGITSKCIIEGLFGIQPDALNGKLIIRPGFPSTWDSAYIKTPYIEMAYHHVNGKKVFDIKQNFPQKLEVVIDTVRSKIQGSTLRSAMALATSKNPQPSARLCRMPQAETLFDDVKPSECRTVDISQAFNANITDIFKNDYLTPACPYTTLRIPKNGYGEWCHPLDKASTNDSVFRSLVHKGIYTANSIPFASEKKGKNIIYTSLWDNYPDSVIIKLRGKASHAYLMMAGTTNPMQSSIANGIITIEYTDGTHQLTELINPDNWCPIEQDYYVDGQAFYTSMPRPFRVHLMSDIVSRDLGKDLSITGVYGREIKGGAAELLDIRLNPKKKLHSLTVRTLSNDVVIGLMAITLQ